jgi:protein SCO1/2
MLKSNGDLGFFLALLAIFAHSAAWSEGLAQALNPGEKKAIRREVQLPIADFSLTDQFGRAFWFHSLRGRVVLLSFVYTSCPDVCPLITASALAVQKALRARERESVSFLTITTDPEVDAPAVLKSYAARFGVDMSNWSFLTGDVSSLAPVWKSFGVKVKRKGRGLVDHTPLTALVDRRGILRVVYVASSPDSKLILRDIRALMSNLPHEGVPKA